MVFEWDSKKFKTTQKRDFQIRYVHYDPYISSDYPYYINVIGLYKREGKLEIKPSKHTFSYITINDNIPEVFMVENKIKNKLK